ncbi:PEP-CTERM sorting domain-containing protein [Pelotalea chapellei]|uniref:PEP-CTERM sorting domain-containing protein n=1 Tax=Pelotalea chapellei TaxID=44671 RepID=A0ABS5U5H0_9BACT|nr:PEP-CTERM sorting domain-containing protein [Pelotalea chapellei]MBT1070904.1 PEP-CTERM sorting domain-containing protein [Pelotalea chapellei]
MTGSFDINPAVPTGNDFTLPYVISSASATIKLSDDLDKLTLQNSITGNYEWNNQYVGNFKQYIRLTTNWFINAMESVSLNISGVISTDGTSWYDLGLTSGNVTYDNAGGREKIKYYTQIATGEHGYRGDVYLTQIFNPAQISDLSNDGIINFSLTGTQGDLTYVSGSLTANLIPNPAVSSVPEPGTMVMLGAGMFILAICGKRRLFKS